MVLVLALGVALTSEDDCAACPPGFFCAAGAAEPIACGLGSVQPEPEQGACTFCSAGKFMDMSGRTACLTCTLGSCC